MGFDFTYVEAAFRLRIQHRIVSVSRLPLINDIQLGYDCFMNTVIQSKVDYILKCWSIAICGVSTSQQQNKKAPVSHPSLTLRLKDFDNVDLKDFQTCSICTHNRRQKRYSSLSFHYYFDSYFWPSTQQVGMRINSMYYCVLG